MKTTEEVARDALNREAHKVGQQEINEVSMNRERVRNICDEAEPLRTHRDEIEEMADMVDDAKNGDFFVPWRIIAAIVGTILYVICPIDAIPDFIPVLGWIDDASVVTACFSLVSGDMEAYRQWRSRRNESDE